jgi:hypothetical protein
MYLNDRWRAGEGAGVRQNLWNARQIASVANRSGEGWKSAMTASHHELRDARSGFMTAWSVRVGCATALPQARSAARLEYAECKRWPPCTRYGCSDL